MEKLSSLFKFFKFTPRVSDPLTDSPRNILLGIRDQEREIMRIAVKVCGMPRKDFISSYQGSETDMRWAAACSQKRPMVPSSQPKNGNLSACSAAWHR